MYDKICAPSVTMGIISSFYVRHVRKLESIMGVQIPVDLRVQPLQWETSLETRLAEFPHWNGGPEGWDFPLYPEH